MSEDLAWAAGFFDGEGYVGLNKGPRSLSVVIAVNQVDRRPLDKLVTLFGGTVRGPYKKKNPNWTPIHNWSIGALKARTALEKMMPYLIIKQDRAKEVLEHWKKYSELPFGTKKNNIKDTDDEENYIYTRSSN